MLAGMGSRRFEEWKAFWELEPFGDEWRQAAVQCAAATQPYSKKQVDLESFMPRTRGVELQKRTSVWGKVTDFLIRKRESFKRGNRRGN